jgi:hypothetical protein
LADSSCPLSGSCFLVLGGNLAMVLMKPLPYK